MKKLKFKYLGGTEVSLTFKKASYTEDNTGILLTTKENGEIIVDKVNSKELYDQIIDGKYPISPYVAPPAPPAVTTLEKSLTVGELLASGAAVFSPEGKLVSTDQKVLNIFIISDNRIMFVVSDPKKITQLKNAGWVLSK